MAAEPAPDAGRTVRVLADSDTAETALLHARELPDGFFPRLGAGFLRTYHRSFVDSPHAVAYVAGSGGRPDGFLLAVLAPAPHGTHVLRHWGARLAVTAALSLLRQPRVLLVFLRTRVRRYARGLWRRRRAASAGGTGTTAGTWAVLSHVAVRGSCRGTGAGAALVRRLHEDVVAAGAAGVVLLTESDGPGPGFYRRLGYEDEGEVLGGDGHLWRRFRWRVG